MCSVGCKKQKNYLSRETQRWCVVVVVVGVAGREPLTCATKAEQKKKRFPLPVSFWFVGRYVTFTCAS